jgi:uncharacterized protein YcbX
MKIEIGQVEAIYRYPVKSMASEALNTAELGWHGLEGDRRLALRRLADRTGFPWLSASQFPGLLLFTPQSIPPGDAGLPTHVRTPDGRDLPTFGADLAAEVTRLYGGDVQMMHMRQGIFDEGSVSVITLDTVGEISRQAEQRADVRRFRPNIVVRSLSTVPFHEDEWVGGTLSFGEEPNAPAIAVTLRDVRCAMLNIDPDSGVPTPQMMKVVVRLNQNHAGVYGTVIRTGQIVVGQTITFHPAAEKIEDQALTTHN